MKKKLPKLMKYIIYLIKKMEIKFSTIYIWKNKNGEKNK
jgi:hypothetical protein